MQINYKHKSLFFQKDGSSFYEFNIVNSKFLVYQIYNKFFLKPGAKIKSPDEVNYDYSNDYFRKIIFQTINLEYLKLKRPNHIRAFFSMEDKWKGTYLVP